VNHPEFGGRLTVKFTGGTDGEHATHVAGTMIAEGKSVAAKGMAPAATLTEFSARSGFLREKETTLPSLGIVADNNSWGYILGWESNEGWVWTGNDDLFGGYIDINAAVDEITRTQNVLFFHSSGNEAEKFGPTVAPFTHYHEDDNGDPVRDKTYCYSANGSGTDCAAPCSTGPQYCETVRHPVNAPWVSLGLLASSKNVVTVGAVIDASNVAAFSSRGPTRDGRVKPDLVARGVGVYSTVLNSTYGRKQGTSMATPVVTGISALLTEQWRRTYAATPKPAVLKALLIAGADDLGTPGPDYRFGHGLANAKAAVDLIREDGGSGSRIRVADATQGSQAEMPLTVVAGQKLRATLVWTDPEVLTFGPDGTAAATLVNDLDLKIIDPAGNTVLPYVLNKDDVEAAATRAVNTVDNVEVVEIAAPVSGTYRAVVTGRRITAQSPQQYVLVTNGALGAAAAPCVDPSEPNETAATAYGFIGSTQVVTGRICAATDVDNFKFKVDRIGTINVTVTATDTPVRVKVTGEGFPTSTSADVPPGESRTMQLQYSGSAPTQFNIEVVANGTLGATGTYFVNAKFPLSAPARRRSGAR
jgi:hypothetical protein